MALQLIPRRRILPNPSLNHLFSTTSNSDDRNDQSKPSSSSSSSSSTSDSLSSYFSDVKASLRRQHQFTPPSPPRSPTGPSSPNHPSSPPSKVAPLEEIRKYLSEFRHLSAPDSAPTPSFQDLYKRNALENAWNSNPEKPGGGGGGRPSLGAIRESLRQMKLSESARTDRGGKDPLSLSAFKSSLRLKPMDSPPSPLPPRTTVIGGTEALPLSLFGKEMKERKDGDGSSAMKTEFVKMYSHEELGEKLKKLRPEGKGEGWFSMEELNERLMRLREMEEKERESITHGLPFKELRESLENLKISSDNEKGRKTSIARLGVLGLLGQTPSYMMQPPKEHLVEKYFHPDNMSSAEKKKLELAKVRDEFKMSESDCGSARVQVAQLTTKIKHLSTVLHKKDKHSRKGLVAMVQRRKRLLKYLRRTDWDSYCFVLDKLGLRDNPGYKN